MYIESLIQCHISRFIHGQFFTAATSPKTNMDTQNDGLEKVDSFKIWPSLVSMSDFSGVCLVKGFFRVAWYFNFWQHLYISARGNWRMGSHLGHVGRSNLMQIYSDFEEHFPFRTWPCLGWCSYTVLGGSSQLVSD